MRGGNYLNPTVLGFPFQVSDGGYFGLVLDFNDAVASPPYFAIDFTNGQWGALDPTNGGYITFTLGANISSAPNTFVEFNASGMYWNGVQIIDNNGEIYTGQVTFIQSFSNAFYQMINETGDVTLSSLSGVSTTLEPEPSVNLGAGQTGSAAFLDLNPTNLGFRVKLVLSVAAIANSDLFDVVFGQDVISGSPPFSNPPKVVWSPTNQAAANLATGTIPFPASTGITSSGFTLFASGILPANTYEWDFIIFG